MQALFLPRNATYACRIITAQDSMHLHTHHFRASRVLGSQAFMAMLKPWPSSPRRFSCDTRTPSRLTEQVGCAFQPIFASCFPKLNPGVPCGIAYRVIGCDPAVPAFHAVPGQGRCKVYMAAIMPLNEFVPYLLNEESRDAFGTWSTCPCHYKVYICNPSPADERF